MCRFLCACTFSTPLDKSQGAQYCIICCSVAKSCPTLWEPMNCSTSGFSVLHYLLEFAQIHVHWVGNAFQPSHSATFFTFCFQSFSSSGSFQLSWLFASDGQSIEASASASVLNVQGWFPIGLTGLTYLPFKGLVRVFSNTTIWKYQFFGTQPSLQSNSHIHTVLLEKS